MERSILCNPWATCRKMPSSSPTKYPKTFRWRLPHSRSPTVATNLPFTTWVWALLPPLLPEHRARPLATSKPPRAAITERIAAPAVEEAVVAAISDATLWLLPMPKRPPKLLSRSAQRLASSFPAPTLAATNRTKRTTTPLNPALRVLSRHLPPAAAAADMVVARAWLSTDVALLAEAISASAGMPTFNAVAVVTTAPVRAVLRATGALKARTRNRAAPVKLSLSSLVTDLEPP